MRTHFLVAVFLVVSHAAAQESARVQPVGLAPAISRASGLQADPGGDGLLGFGAAYLARFRAGGMHFDVTQGRGTPAAFVALTAPVVTRGGTTLPTSATVMPDAHDRRASYRRADGVDERYDIGPDGIELSWRFAERPPGEGDLVVRYAVESSFGEPTAADGGLKFTSESCAVTIGKVTGVDRNGAAMAGSMRWDGRGVCFTLPATFVDGAAYPIVLDPVFGVTFSVALGNLGTGCDAAYDATTDRWLIVWVRPGAPNDLMMAQLVSNASGALIGSAILLALNDAVGPPRVANHGLRDEFAIAFTTLSLTSPTSGMSFLVVARVSAITGSNLGPTTVATASGTTHQFIDVNIGALAQPVAGSNSGFTLAYFDLSTPINEIKAQRLTYSPSGSLAAGPAAPIWSSAGSVSFSSLRMSRTAAADGKLLAVAARDSIGAYSIVATLLDTGSDVPGLTGDVVVNTGQPTFISEHVDVDGYAGRWVIAYEAPGSGLLSGPGIRVRPVTIDAAGSSFVAGASSTFGGFATNQAHAPLVAFAPGRAWLAYRATASLIGGGVQQSRRVVAVDGGSCVSCGDSFSVPLSTAPALMQCIATTTSGGAANGEDALFVWADPSATSNALFAQRLRDFGTAGTTVSLGGGCGGSGTVAFNHAPGIGSSGFRCSLNGIPATALLPIFNFSAPSATISCGACVWTPFAITQTPPIAGGSAFVEFAIPCLLSLVGQQFEVQWTLIDVGQAPCPLFPGFALSNRTLLTIGN